MRQGAPAATPYNSHCAGKIVNDRGKDAFFGGPDARSPRAKDCLCKILPP